jgi:hypothetical protein
MGQTLGRLGVADFAGLVVLVGVGVVIGVAFAFSTFKPVDTDMIWRIAQGPVRYGTTWAADPQSRYVYPPPLGQFASIFVPLGWPAFVVVWTIGIFSGLWAMTRSISLAAIGVAASSAVLWGLDSPLANPLTLALVGNIQPVLAAAIILGLRWPILWAFVVLTKITPGVGLLWFAFRREWRNLALAIGAISVVACISFLVDPASWFDFARFAIANANTPPPIPILALPLPARVVMSVVLIYWGARTDRPWILPFAAGWSSLALYEWSWVTMALASVAMYWWARSGRALTPSLR